MPSKHDHDIDLQQLKFSAICWRVHYISLYSEYVCQRQGNCIQKPNITCLSTHFAYLINCTKPLPYVWPPAMPESCWGIDGPNLSTRWYGRPARVSGVAAAIAARSRSSKRKHLFSNTAAILRSAMAPRLHVGIARTLSLSSRGKSSRSCHPHSAVRHSWSLRRKRRLCYSKTLPTLYKPHEAASLQFMWWTNSLDKHFECFVIVHIMIPNLIGSKHRLFKIRYILEHPSTISIQPQIYCT